MSKDAGFTSKHLEDRVNKLLKDLKNKKVSLMHTLKEKENGKKIRFFIKKSYPN